ncbi:uncharacterized protein [Spinacia oleracea]|uniref:Uncharacterized protein n=1 Tax=Spinacia oleracea TaxID=3562 RepID=A0ABM3R5J7_SPIOL|nr:uncharacterized protein LOC130466190 [Spinacia oleracea]
MVLIGCFSTALRGCIGSSEFKFPIGCGGFGVSWVDYLRRRFPPVLEFGDQRLSGVFLVICFLAISIKGASNVLQFLATFFERGARRGPAFKCKVSRGRFTKESVSPSSGLSLLGGCVDRPLGKDRCSLSMCVVQ